jgi:hypothetical protein
MEVLREARNLRQLLTFIWISLVAIPSFGSLNEKEIKVPSFEKNCLSGEEFKKAYEYLKREEGLSRSEGLRIQEALLISEGCDQATFKFEKVYSLLKKSGVDLKQSFLIALRYTKMPEDVIENFREIFKKIFLENYLDMDFSTALRFATALSENYEGHPQNLREDFTSLVKFCTQEQEMALSVKVCGGIVLDVTQWSRYYPEGLFPSFLKVYRFLRTHKQMGLSVGSSLKIVTRVLAKGPKAPENFVTSIEYALNTEKMSLNPSQALKLGLAVAEQSQFRRSIE